MGRALWVYEKGRAARTSKNLDGECVERGYFAGASNGESEQEVDERFNSEYEAPFNRILPSIDANLHIFDSREIREITARYVSHIFHRTLALRSGNESLMSGMLSEYSSIAADPTRLRGYTAKISVVARKPVAMAEVKAALLRSTEEMLTETAVQSRYVNDIDRATGALASKLVDLRWSAIRCKADESFVISDTPIVSITKDRFGKVSYGEGISKPMAEWFLPISHHRVIRISHNAAITEFADEKIVRELNAAQILTMSRRVMVGTTLHGLTRRSRPTVESTNFIEMFSRAHLLMPTKVSSTFRRVPIHAVSSHEWPSSEARTAFMAPNSSPC
ncbi:hypothetical protein HDF12_001081 [Edaphobacter lichenicola]|uniref:Uncharacterized protein n=1 Tax=Tunturiibacter lichenicola TaxID=2051959 RepID=A0A7Y9NJW3_9BACT|nr:hypothetical protein [Edaphobacter lichenicola]